jgi:hypothetical protein
MVKATYSWSIHNVNTYEYEQDMDFAKLICKQRLRRFITLLRNHIIRNSYVESSLSGILDVDDIPVSTRINDYSITVRTPAFYDPLTTDDYVVFIQFRFPLDKNVGDSENGIIEVSLFTGEYQLIRCKKATISLQNKEIMVKL